MRTSAKRGHFIRRHDRVVRWLAGWIEDRIGSQVLVEPAIAAEGEEEDRLDLTLESGGGRLWLDVAVVNVLTINVAERLRRAKLDGAAARHEEGAKKSRYRGLATPFVIEAHGRPGDFACSIIGSPRILSRGTPRTSRRLGSRFRPSFNPSPLLWSFGRVGTRLPTGITSGIISSSLFFPTEVTTGIDVEHRGTGPVGHARILSKIIVSNWFHSGSTDMSSLPRPMVSVGTATSLPPLPGPAPSPTSRRRRGRLRLAQPLRTLAAASWRRRRDAAAGLPLVLLHLRAQAPLGRYSLSGAFAAALDGAAV